MSSKPMMAMPSIQGEAVELFPRKPPTPINTGRPMSRESLPEDNEALLSTILTRRPSTSASENRAPVVSPGQARAGDVQQESKNRANDVGGGRPPLAGGPRCVGGDLDGDCDKRGSSAPEATTDVNAIKSKLMGGYLRERLLGNANSKHAAKELVKRSFRHLHRGQGHVLTLDEFKEGLSNTFGALIPLQLILATFDIFDTEPRTWQLDFDEFCHWLETGERSLNSIGISEALKPVALLATDLPKARKPRSNDSSGGMKPSAKNAQGMSMEQADRAMLKAHLMKHRNKLHKASGFTDAQKSVVDHILLEKIRARKKTDATAKGRMDGLGAFKEFSRGSERMGYPFFKKQIASMMPDLKGEFHIKELFSRMDHNGDGVVDLTDFLMWEERMQDGRGHTDYWALQEEEHLEQIKLARSKASNLLVPDDYDGSTHHAKLARDKAKEKLADDADEASREPGDRQGRRTDSNREELAQALRDNILSQVKGGSLELLRAFRHFRPAAVGRRLFVDYREFRESIKQKGLGLSEENIKSLFGYFDVGGSGEIDFSEFRRFLQGDIDQTGLAPGVNRHEEKTAAARRRVTSLDTTATAFDSSLAGEARSDELIKAKVLRKIAGGKAEVLRALRGFGAENSSSATLGATYPCFVSAVSASDFGLSDPETKQLFNKFKTAGPSANEDGGVPTGTMNAQAFREWLLESGSATGPDVGKIAKENMSTSVGDIAIASEQAAEHFGLSTLHKQLRAKVMDSFKSDHRNLLRAFRRVTRKKGSDITAGEFREAMESFGLGGDKASADRLYKIYDWRQTGTIDFQELMETITKNEHLPRKLNTGQRKQRLEVARKLSDEAIKQVETKLRKGLWKKHLDDAEACFRSLTSGEGGVMGLPALKLAARNAGVSSDDACDQVLMRVLHKRATAARGERWSMSDFISFYRPAECRAAIALARERSGSTQSNVDAKRAALVGEGNKARTKLLSQVRRLSDVLRMVDINKIGKVSRRVFAKALEKEGGLGKVGEAELTRLLLRHRCAEQGGSYVNYPVFVASFTAAVRGADSSSAVAAVAAATAAAAAAAEAAATAPPKLPSKCPQPGEPSRSSSNLHLALVPPRPSTASAVKGASQGGYTKPNATGDLPSPGACEAIHAGGARARTADASSRERRKRAGSVERNVELSAPQGYSKRFVARGGEIDRGSFMQGSRSAPVLPNLVGQRPEVPKTTAIHRIMKKDVTRSAKALRKAFKQCENPYRRGVVSAAQFQAVCLKNGVNVDREDVEFLMRQHRHKPSMGGKYAIAPAWVQAPAVTATGVEGSAATSKIGVRYDDFLRTCLAANDLLVPAH